MNRLRICRVLAERPATVTELIEAVGLSQPLVSWHLGQAARGRASSRRAATAARPSTPSSPRRSSSSPPGRRAPSASPARRPPGRPPRERLVRLPDLRARVRGLMTPIAVGLGRPRPHPQRPDADRLRDRDHRRRRRGRPGVAARRPAVRVRRRVRPVRRRARPGDRQGQQGSARSWTPRSTAGARRSSTSGIVVGRDGARHDLAVVLAAAAMALRVHGQLHPRQVREPRLRARHRHGQRRSRPARGPDRHPHRWASSSPGCCAGDRSDGAATAPNVIALELALGLIAVLATITTIQRIVVTCEPGPTARAGLTPQHGAGAREQHQRHDRDPEGTRQEDPRRDRRRRQLREQPRPGPLLLREREATATSSRA